MSDWNCEDDFIDSITFVLFNPQVDEKNRIKVKEFLLRENLRFVDTIKFTLAVFKNKELIATGSLDDDVLKCFAIREDFRKKGLTNKILNILTEEAFKNNKTHLFIYTKPENCELFESLGYHKIIKIPELVVLMENKSNGLKKYLDRLKKHKVDGNKISSIVMNCNPFTNGHLYLVEKAARENDIVHLFVLTEDKSEFSAEDRMKMVKLGTKHLENVIIHPAGKYIISSATFPSYFIKDEKNIVKAHAYLDLTLFSKYIAKALDINSRYVGEEPYSNLTREYNYYMKEILPEFGISVIEVPRKEFNKNAISASKVRNLLSEGKIQEVKELVPKTTFDYLMNLK